MGKLTVGKFNDKGQMEQVVVDLPADVLAVCLAPTRFMGGGCDLFYVCTRRHEGFECKAEASITAREKVEHDKAEGNLQPEHKCACCDEVIDLVQGEAPYHGDTGTRYAGQPICDGCYDEDLSEPSAVIIRGTALDEDERELIGSCRNETNGDFEVRWTSTDAWRGYFSMSSEKYEKVFDDVILSGDASEERLKSFYDLVLQAMAEHHIDVARCFPRTSNVFACGLELWAEKGQAQKARQIIRACSIVKEVSR